MRFTNNLLLLAPSLLCCCAFAADPSRCGLARTSVLCAQRGCAWCATASGAGRCTALATCPPSLMAPKARAVSAADTAMPASGAPCDGSAASASLPAAECTAWQDFHSRTNGTAWVFGCQDMRADPCACNYTVQGLPAGVTCKDGHITSMQFAFNGLQGELSASLGALTHLTELQLCGNPGLGGELTPNVAKLVNLVDLDVSGCAMSGAVPDVSPLTQLFSLTLYDNSFSSTLPPTLGRGMTALTNLAIDHCELEGTIPDSLGSAASLYSIVLGANRLVGTVPAPIGSLKKLKVLSLEANLLSGVPPPLRWAAYDAMCDVTGNNFTCPCEDVVACKSDANWMEARKHCNASCHFVA